jgi:hypothetical protein
MKEPMTGGKMSSKMSPANTARRTGDTPAAKKTVVSQAMINKIKAEGMTAAIKKAAAGGAGSAYNEAVKRMYGANRVAKATAANMNSRSSTRTAGYGPDKARGAYANKTAASKPAASKSQKTTDPFAKFVFGVGKAAAEPFKSQPTKKK